MYPLRLLLFKLDPKRPTTSRWTAKLLPPAAAYP
jgi:hypothetical protein